MTDDLKVPVVLELLIPVLLSLCFDEEYFFFALQTDFEVLDWEKLLAKVNMNYT